VFKIVDRFVLKTFLPLFAMSFSVCWFIVVMQFLWRYVDELVGKGLGVFVLCKIIFYAAMSFIPMSLPLGILLASLMTFGNLGERLELLALKASGIPLYRIMRPLFLLIGVMSVLLFQFQNDWMIQAQVRMWTLVLSAKYAAPEMEITEGVFYTGIPGYSLYAQHRDPSGRMEQLMVYDMSRGYLNPRIIRADSGRLVMDKSKTFLVLKLYNGQSYENLRAQSYNTSEEPIPYMLPHFTYSETFIAHNTNINYQDEKQLGGLYISKNLSQLNYSIDSTARLLDSARAVITDGIDRDLLSTHYQSFAYGITDTASFIKQREELTALTQRIQEAKPHEKANGDSLLILSSATDSLRVIQAAVSTLERTKNQASFAKDEDDNSFYYFRTYSQEWHRKFTASVACLIFFLIGAPLGAIVRRGGIGMPVIVSIFFFVVYYTIESFGDNMLRSETIPVWLGMWLSNLVLLPVGLFLTYKSNQDSSSLNAEAYVMFFRKLFGYRGVRNVEYQEVSIEEVDYKQATLDLDTLLEQTETLRTSPLFQSPIIRVWSNGSDQAKLRDLSTALDDLVESLRHSTSRLLVSKLKDLPLLPKHFSPLLPEQSKYGWIMSFILPYSIPMTLYFSRLRKHLLGDLETTKRTLLALQEEVMSIQKGTREQENEQENQTDETNPIYANQLQPNLS
jgi:hypothetical protein